MIAEGLIYELRRRGIELYLEEEQLRFRARPGAMTEALRAEIAAHREALLAPLLVQACRERISARFDALPAAALAVVLTAPWTAAEDALNAALLAIPVGQPGAIDQVRAALASWEARSVELLEAWLQALQQALPPDRRCYACGQRRWYRPEGRPDWLCAVCHPPLPAPNPTPTEVAA